MSGKYRLVNRVLTAALLMACCIVLSTITAFGSIKEAIQLDKQGKTTRQLPSKKNAASSPKDPRSGVGWDTSSSRKRRPRKRQSSRRLCARNTQMQWSSCKRLAT